MHAVRDALAYGVKVTGCTVFLVDAGIDTGPVIAQARGSGRATGDDVASLHERIKVAERALLVDTSAGWSGTAGPCGAGPAVGHHERRRPARPARDEEGPSDNVPIRRALVSVYDKTGLDELAGALRPPVCRSSSTGSTAAAIAAAGVPVTGVEDVTGFPECLEGRVKTLHPPGARRAARRHRPARACRSSSPGWASSRSSCWCPTCTRSRPRSPPARAPAECVEQIDIGGPAMVRAAAKNHARRGRDHRPGAVPGSGRGGRRRRLHPRAAAAAGRRGVRPHRALRRRSRVLVRAAYAPDDVARETGWPGRGPGTWDPRDGAALRREPASAALPSTRARAHRPAWPRPSSCTARRCPTTTTSTPTRRGGPRSTSPSRAWRSSSTRTRAASPSGPTWREAHRRPTHATRGRPTAG